MNPITFIYFSQSGSTLQIVEAAAKGVVEASSVEAQLLRIEGRDIQEGRWANDGILDVITLSTAVIFATPTFMGGRRRSSKPSRTQRRRFGSSRSGGTNSPPA